MQRVFRACRDALAPALGWRTPGDSSRTSSSKPQGTAQPVPGGFCCRPGATPGAAAPHCLGTNPGTTPALNVQIRPPVLPRTVYPDSPPPSPRPAEPADRDTVFGRIGGERSQRNGRAVRACPSFGFAALRRSARGLLIEPALAPRHRPSEQPLQLSGETPVTPTQAPITTAQDRAPPHPKPGSLLRALLRHPQSRGRQIRQRVRGCFAQRMLMISGAWDEPVKRSRCGPYRSIVLARGRSYRSCDWRRRTIGVRADLAV